MGPRLPSGLPRARRRRSPRSASRRPRAHRDRHRRGHRRHRAPARRRPLRVVNTGLYRPNLRYRVAPGHERGRQAARALVAWSRRATGSGIVYAATVKARRGRARRAARRRHRRRALPRQAGAARAPRAAGRLHGRRGRASWSRPTRSASASTSPTSASSSTTTCPARLEAYYQEAGRAGRDGQIADCMLLFLPSDKRVQQFFLAGRYPTREDVADLYGALQGEGPADGAAGRSRRCSRRSTGRRPSCRSRCGCCAIRASSARVATAAWR